jgi:hypothetical protein
MEKWEILGQAFRDIGSDLATVCKKTGNNCRVDEEFEELYPIYVAMLEALKTQRERAAVKFRKISKRLDIRDGVVAWIIENVDASVIPADEGNDTALVYNLVHLAMDGEGFRPYNYEPEQDDEIDDLRVAVLK